MSADPPQKPTSLIKPNTLRLDVPEAQRQRRQQNQRQQAE
jgi:hypothetical protein